MIGEPKDFFVTPGCENSDYEIYRSLSEIRNDKQLPLYKQGVLKYSLVYEKEPISDMTDELFYGRRIKQKEHQVNRLVSMKKTFHRFFVLELSELSGTIAMKTQFVFPRYLDHEQHLFVSEDSKKLLEIIGEEAYIYPFA